MRASQPLASAGAWFDGQAHHPGPLAAPSDEGQRWLREAAEQLKQQAENAALTPLERRRAEDALVQLYLLTRDNRGEAA